MVGLLRLDRSFIVVFLSRGEEEKETAYLPERIYLRNHFTHVFPSTNVLRTRARFPFRRKRIDYNLIATNIFPHERKFASHAFVKSFLGRSKKRTRVEMLVFRADTACNFTVCNTGQRGLDPGKGKKRIKNRGDVRAESISQPTRVYLLFDR